MNISVPKDIFLFVTNYYFWKKKMFKIRKAIENDIPTIFEPDKKIVSLRKTRKWSHHIWKFPNWRKIFSGIILLQKSSLLKKNDKKPYGFALYFYNFSTFVGKPGIYLEDLFVEPECRGKGYGKALLVELAKMAEGKLRWFEWSVLDWNTPSIDFYKSLGAKPMDEWTVFRLDKKGVSNLANN